MASGDRIRSRGTAARLAGRLGQLLTDARGARTRADLARELGVSTSTLAGIERGAANPTLAYLEALGPAYGVRLDITSTPLEATDG